MEVVQGVYQIKLPLLGAALASDDGQPIKASKDKLISVIEQKILEPAANSYVNVYLIEGKEGNVLVDTGWNTPESYSILNNELRTYGFDLKDISQIVVTHLHPDHYGLAGRIKQVSGAKIALSEVEAGMLDSRYVNLDNLLEQVLLFLDSNGVPQDDVFQLSEASLPLRGFVLPTSPDIKLKNGKKISIDPFEFKVILTPGHSPGHVCLYEPNRKLLFSGDHVLPEISPHVGLHPQSGQDPLGDYLSSLKALADLEVNLVLPGHGPAFSGLKKRVEELLYHHEQRKSGILSVVQNDMKTAYQIAVEIPWMTDIKAEDFQSLNMWNRRLAVMETLAHLQLLVKEGKVKKTVKDGTSFYRAEG